jgi:hypothetical protein
VIRGNAKEALLTSESNFRATRIVLSDGRNEEIEAQVVLDWPGMATLLANQKAMGRKFLGSCEKKSPFSPMLSGRLRSRQLRRNGAE